MSSGRQELSSMLENKHSPKSIFYPIPAFPLMPSMMLMIFSSWREFVTRARL